jgi:hypothetical protein
MNFKLKILALSLMSALAVGCGGDSDTTPTPTNNTGNTDTGNTDTGNNNNNQNELPSNLNVLTNLAGSYEVKSTATNYNNSRGTENQAHQRKTIIIGTNGDVDFDTGLNLDASKIQAIYDRRNLCDMEPHFAIHDCRVHVNYGTDDSGEKLEIYLDPTDKTVIEIRYQDGLGKITRASMLADSSAQNNDPKGVRNLSDTVLDLGASSQLKDVGQAATAWLEGDQVHVLFVNFSLTSSTTANPSGWSIIKLDQTGKMLDTAFGAQGLLTLTTANTTYRPIDFAKDQDNNLYLLTRNPNDANYYLNKFNSNGEADTNWPHHNKRLTGSNPSLDPNQLNFTVPSLDVQGATTPITPTSMTIDEQGNLFIGGWAAKDGSLKHWAVAKIATDGTITTNRIKQPEPEEHQHSQINRIFYQSGDIFAIGVGQPGKTLVTKITPDLSINTEFGTQGFISPFGNTPNADWALHDLKVDESKRLLIAGTGKGGENIPVFTSSVSSGLGYNIYRFLENGQPDPSWGTDGLVTVDFHDNGSSPFDDRAYQIEILNSQNILIAGSSIAQTGSNKKYLSMALLNESDGSLIEDFWLYQKSFIDSIPKRNDLSWNITYAISFTKRQWTLAWYRPSTIQNR